MYRDLNDYEILYLIKEENDFDYNVILDKYKPLIYKISLKYINICKKFGFEIDDVMQVGYIALFKAIKCYQCDYDLSIFYTFLTHVIENNIISIIRKNTTLKCKILNDSISYDILMPDGNASY